MRETLCCACLAVLRSDRRNVLADLRAHVLETGHPLVTMRCLDVEATARRLIGEALGTRPTP